MSALKKVSLAPVLFVALLWPATVIADPITALYVIGDSLSDQGNAFSLTALTGGFPPAPYAQRASNGPVAVERLAGLVGVPLTASEQGGTNFAVVGALTGPAPIPMTPAFTDNLSAVRYGQPALFGTGMLSQVADVLAGGPISDPAGALFVMWGGANDLFLNPSPTGAAVAINNLTAALQALYAAGARRFFVPNLPDLSQTPSGRSLPLFEQAVLQQLILGFNAGLGAALGGLSALPGMQMTPFDTFSLLNAIAFNPGAYGFTNVTDACLTGDFATGGHVCATPDSYLFWDSVHPSAAAHQVLAGAFQAAVQPVPEPATLMLLGVGLAITIVVRRRAIAR